MSTKLKVRLSGGPHVSQEMAKDIEERAEQNGTSQGIEIEVDHIKAKAYDNLLPRYQTLLRKYKALLKTHEALTS